jgi:hypothetical protein
MTGRDENSVRKDGIPMDFEHPAPLPRDTAPPADADLDRAIATWNNPKTRWYDAETLVAEILRSRGPDAP